MEPRQIWIAATGWVARVAAIFAVFGFVVWANEELTQRRLLVQQLEQWQLPANLPVIAARLDELWLTGDVDRVDWLPPGVKILYLEDTGIQRPDLPAGVEQLYARGARLESLEGLPSELRLLDLRGNPLSEGIELPVGLRSLTLGVDQLIKLSSLPPSLEELVVHETGIDIEVSGLPQKLRTLRLKGVGAKSLGGLPQGLQELELDATEVAWVRPWPKGLRKLVLTHNRNLSLGTVEVEKWPRLLTHLVYVGGKDQVPCSDLPESLHSIHLAPPCIGTLDHLPQLRSVVGAGRDLVTLSTTNGLRHLEISASGQPMKAEDLEKLEGLAVETLSVLGLDAENLSVVPDGTRRVVLRDCALDRLARLPGSVRSLEITLCEFAESAIPVDNPENGSSWSELEELVYPWSPWESLPDVFGGLESLDLSGSDIRALPESMPDLRELRINGTCVASLPGELPGLEVLDVSETPINDLEEIPGTVRDLRIHLGQFRHLGDDLGQLRVLRIVRPTGPPASRCNASSS